jgi:hypothetical protein
MHRDKAQLRSGKAKTSQALAEGRNEQSWRLEQMQVNGGEGVAREGILRCHFSFRHKDQEGTAR